MVLLGLLRLRPLLPVFLHGRSGAWASMLQGNYTIDGRRKVAMLGRLPEKNITMMPQEEKGHMARKQDHRRCHGDMMIVACYGMCAEHILGPNLVISAS